MDIISKLKWASGAKQQEQDATGPAHSIIGKKLKVNNNLYTIKGLVAEGGFSFVYEVQAASDFNVYAMKIIQVHDDEGLSVVKREVRALKSLPKHGNIVTFKESEFIRNMRSSSSQSLWEVRIVMEYCEESVIGKMNSRQNSFSEVEVLQIFHDMLEAVLVLHSHENGPIFHRDLKAENLLIGSDGKYKLCDFGSVQTKVPRLVSSEDIAATEVDIQKYTTMAYRSPEMIDLYLRKPIFLPADIWALGCVLYKLCFYRSPFEDGGPLQILNCKYTFPDHPQYSQEIRNLVAFILNADCDSRPNIVDVLNACERIPGSPPGNSENYYLRERFLNNYRSMKVFMNSEVSTGQRALYKSTSSIPSGIDEEDFADFDSLEKEEEEPKKVKQIERRPQKPPNPPADPVDDNGAATISAFGDSSFFDQLEWAPNDEDVAARGSDMQQNLAQDVPKIEKQDDKAGEVEATSQFVEEEEDLFGGEHFSEEGEPEGATGITWLQEDGAVKLERAEKDPVQPQQPEKRNNPPVPQRPKKRENIPSVVIERSFEDEDDIPEYQQGNDQHTSKIASITGIFKQVQVRTPHHPTMNETERWMSKALGGSSGPPKAKYVRKLVMEGWKSISKEGFIKHIYSALEKRELDKSSTTALKGIIVIHRLILQGFREFAEVSYKRKIEYFKQLRNAWKANRRKIDAGSTRFDAHAKIYSKVIVGYLTLIIDRLHFIYVHNYFEGNYSLELAFENVKKKGGKIVLGKQQPMDLQKLLERASSTMKIMMGIKNDPVIQAAIVTVAEDLYFNHIAQTFILVRLAKSNLSGEHSNIISTYYGDFSTLRTIFDELLSRDGVKSLLSVPRFPKRSLDFSNPRSLPLVKAPPSMIYTLELKDDSEVLLSDKQLKGSVSRSLSMENIGDISDETSEEDEELMNSGQDKEEVEEEKPKISVQDLFDDKFGEFSSGAVPDEVERVTNNKDPDPEEGWAVDFE